MSGHKQSGSIQRNHLPVKIIILMISLCLSFLGAEFVLRKVRPVDTGKSHEFRIPHPVLGWTLQPGISYSNRLPEDTVQVAYNAEGWRDYEHSREKLRGTSRVVLLGDSFMEAYSVDLQDSFHRQVELALNKSGVDAELINLGVGGYGTLQEYLVFQEAGARYTPDIVLVGFYLKNDVRNNSLELESLIAGDPSELTGRPFLDPRDPDSWRITPVDYEGAQRRYEAAQLKNYPLGRELSRRSVLLWIVSEEAMRIFGQVKSFFSGTGKTKARDEVISRERQMMALSGVHYCDEPEEYTGAWNITKRILSRLKRDVEAGGAKLVVFTVPADHETKNSRMKALTEKAGAGVLCLEDAPGYERLRTILEELQITLVDLLPDFRGAAQRGSAELFRLSDSHWNPRGHALAARTVASALIERGLLSPMLARK